METGIGLCPNKKIKERCEAKKKQQEKKQHQSQQQGQSNNSNTTTATTTKAEKQQLIEEATHFIMAKYKFFTIEDSKDILFYDRTKELIYWRGNRNRKK